MRGLHPVVAGSIAAVSLVLTACGQTEDVPDGASAAAHDSSVTEITIFLSDEKGIALDCAAVRPLQWAAPVSNSDDLPSLAVRRVIRDVQPSSTLHAEGTAPLLNYFNGVRIDGSTAVASFDGGALAYLNSTACMQSVAKAPIVRTLLMFPSVEAVVWEIDGEIFDAWDA